jgi:hypothetical protein
MARNNQRGSKNNNPEGRNQYTSGWMGTAKERPMATAAAAAAAVGAGVFLWSRRNQISEQINGLSEQFSDWTSSQQYSGSESGEFEMADSGSSGMASGSSSGNRSSGKSSRGKSGGNKGMTDNMSSASTGNGGATSF